MPGAVADLEEPLPRRAAAAGEAVAAVLARELDAELLEPLDRRGASEVSTATSRSPPSRASFPDVLGVLPGRVVRADRRLDPALRLGGVA